MKKSNLFVLALSAVCFFSTANAEEMRTEKYYREHIVDAKKVVEKCNKSSNVDAPDNCMNAKRAVFFHEHSM